MIMRTTKPADDRNRYGMSQPRDVSKSLDQLMKLSTTWKGHSSLNLLPSVSESLARLSDYFIALGPFGLFAVALLDSAFVPLPSSADALMILLTIAHPRLMIFYALLATAGSRLAA